MDCNEMSAVFDTLYNNINSNQMPGLNEYEKSVFLSKAQSQLVNEYFNNRTDGFGGGFDGSQIRQYDFSNLIKTVKLSTVADYKGIDKRSLAYCFPSDYYLAVNEIINDSQYQYSVIPITYAEYQRLMLKPYAYPVKKAVWRLITSKTEIKSESEEKGTDGKTVIVPVVEILGKIQNPESLEYVLRYVKSLTPIILEDLTDYEGLSIDGYTQKQECLLPKECHHEIVERAVVLAKIAWQGGTATQAAAQSNSNQ